MYIVDPLHRNIDYETEQLNVHLCNHLLAAPPTNCNSLSTGIRKFCNYTTVRRPTLVQAGTPSKEAK